MAIRSRERLADLLVVAVEQLPEGGIVGPIVGSKRLEHEGLEKPGDVRPVPLCGARIWHRLHRLILCRKRGGELLGHAADRQITVDEAMRGRCGVGQGHG